MTRYIEKDKPTQVNADKIGVLVHIETPPVPPVPPVPSDDYIQDGFGTRDIYTASDDLAPGDDTSGEINCTLSYSVDGKTWTDWPENMTDDNNVICNIPRYMYLKFSQDVIITEE